MAALANIFRFPMLAMIIVIGVLGSALAKAQTIEQAVIAFDRGDFEAVVIIVKPLAEAGDARAQELLAKLYFNGRGVPLDRGEAVKWLGRSARQGNDSAQELFFWMTGWFVQTAERGQHAAIIGLLTPLATDENPMVQMMLGQIYLAASPMRDPGVAVAWWRQAAEANIAVVQDELASIYDDGALVPSDPAQAAYWALRAAEQGYSPAQHRLAQFHERGRGVPVNEELAWHWYRLAAHQGLAPSWYQLGRMCEEGRAVPQDDVQALMWYGLSGNHAAGGTQARDRLAGAMSQTDVAEARRLADDWAARFERQRAMTAPRR